MWIVVAREPKPDAPYREGRRWQAAADGVMWPLFWVLAVHQLPASAGLIGPFVAALAVLCAVGRVHHALWRNHRYRFTTWRWAQVAGVVLLFGTVLRLFLAF